LLDRPFRASIDRFIQRFLRQIQSFWGILNAELFSNQLCPVDFGIHNIAREDCIALKVERRDICGVYLSEEDRVFVYGQLKRPMIVLTDYLIDFADRADQNGVPANANARIVSDLLHVMVHQYCVENYIPDVKRKEKHTAAFIAEAKKRGSLLDVTELSPSLSASHKSLWYSMDVNYDYSYDYYQR